MVILVAPPNGQRFIPMFQILIFFGASETARDLTDVSPFDQNRPPTRNKTLEAIWNSGVRSGKLTVSY